MSHLTEWELRSLADGDLAPGGWLRAVRHLLGGCDLCRSKVERVAPFLMAAAPGEESLEPEVSQPATAEAPDGYDEALDRAFAGARKFEKRWQREKSRVPRLLPALQAAPDRGLHALPAQQRERAFGWPLVEALLKVSFEQRYRSPERMAALAEAACRVACATEEEDYPPGLVCDLRARAYAELANARRVQEHYSEAEAALGLAHQSLEEGTEAPGLLARLYVVEASLRRAQRKTSEALFLLTQAEGLYRETGERHLAGRTLVSKGVALYAAGEPRKAIESLEAGMALLDRARDPRLTINSYQALIGYLVKCQEYRRAGELLLESGLRQAFAEEPLNLLRLRWIEGQIQAGLGRLASAEQAFREVRAGFREQDLEYDAALVGLDLAAVWVRQGKHQKVHRLAGQMYATFRAMEISVEASKALRLIQIACEEKLLSLRIVEEVRLFLERLQAEPYLVMEQELRI